MREYRHIWIIYAQFMHDKTSILWGDQVSKIKSFLQSIPPDILGSAIALIILFFLTFGINMVNEGKWNEGVCPDCYTGYMLRGVRKGYSHYVCSECGDEIIRYMEW